MSNVCRICDGTGAYLVDLGRQKIRCSCQPMSRDFWLTLAVAVCIAAMVALMTLPIVLQLSGGKAP